MKDLKINTPKGEIKAVVGIDKDYPSIDIFIDNELAAVVEYDSLSRDIFIHTYKKFKESVQESHVWDDPGEYDY